MKTFLGVSRSRESIFSAQLTLLTTAFLGCLSTVSTQALDGYHTVKVEQGFIKGRLWNITNRQVQVYLGIPYAEPPIGPLRFQKPIKKKPWEGDHIAFEYGPPCIQFMDFHEHDRFSGSNMKRQKEDCLYLNIFSPYEENADTLYPVIVWIHGGSLLAGSSDSGVDTEVALKNIVLKNVTLVTLNYRLGPLGFLSTSLSDAKGNFGIWDQIEALAWLQANIREFNGDPDMVTVMGESAGGSSASLLALSPVTKGLVHRAILMSGSITAGWALQRFGVPNWSVDNLYKYLTCEKKITSEESWAQVEATQDYGCNFMEHALQCDSTVTEKDVYECIKLKADFSNPLMRKAFTYEVTYASPFKPNDDNSFQLGLGQVIIDGEIIPYNVNELLSNLSRVPILIGVADVEWAHKKAVFYGFKSYTSINEQIALEKAQMIVQQSFMPYFDNTLPNSTLKMIALVALHHYLVWNDSGPPWDMTKFVQALQRMESDIEFTAPMLKEIDLYLNNNQSVYLYSFEHVPSNDIVEEEWVNVNLFGLKRKVRTERKLPIKRAFHGLDHAFIFTEGYSSNIFFSYNDADYKVSDAWCRFITNFAKTGNPTPQPVHGIVWPPMESHHNGYLTIDWPLRVTESGARRWRHAEFWNNLIPTLVSVVRGPDESKYKTLNVDEQLQLAAFRRAWWALWVLVAGIAVFLWIVIVCLVTQKCLDFRSRHYKNIIVADV
ncbi:carboxylesterase family protein [Trichuris trichiura]|uniref:Carboxylesterase family protein n=1 Tax=Trichuris trichiura TaxID=36087 RepID=A0A077Z7R0_TRITR|nr:carboxylesterase family protein [Trichuris trichiura]